jgi:putative ABC transport system permease protein
MNLFSIAWKSIKQRALTSTLTSLSVSLGVMLMVAILVLNGVISRQFRQTGSGYDLIVGPAGSATDLVLSTIYRMAPPIENLPWRYYEELKADSRIAHAIPFTFGDTTEVGNFPIIGTTIEYFTIDYMPGRKFGLTSGDWNTNTWEAVIGSHVAKENGWKVGSQFKLVHAGVNDHVHDEKFTVTGILGKTNTPNDRTVFVNLGGFFALAGHEKPVNEAIEGEAQFFGEPLEQVRTKYAKELQMIDELTIKEGPHAGHYHGPVPDFQKEVTSILVKMAAPDNRQTVAQARARELSSEMRAGLKTQAVNPVMVMEMLVTNLVGNIKLVLLVLTWLIIIISGIGIFVSIYNSMSERRKEIAIMRALGADRSQILLIIMCESVLLCFLGGLVGMLLGHVMVFIAAPIIESRAQLLIEPWAYDVYEIYIIPGMIALAIIVGFIPAMSAYRTNVSEHLNS